MLSLEIIGCELVECLIHALLGRQMPKGPGALLRWVEHQGRRRQGALAQDKTILQFEPIEARRKKTAMCFRSHRTYPPWMSE